MDEQFFYPILLIIAGILVSTAAIIVLTRFSNKIIRLFELYPESRGILKLSLRFVSWFVGVVIFLIFLRFALEMLQLEFTMKIVEDTIKLSPKYILAALLLLAGFYTTRLIRERSKDYHFEFKERILLVIEVIIHMTFVFTALFTIGINVSFFLEFYRVILWAIGAIVALVVSMSIGIPLGISIYEKMKKEERRRKK